MQRKQQDLYKDAAAQIWALMIRVKGSLSLDRFLNPVLAVLYSIHKGYDLSISRNCVSFPKKKDKLYCDLLEMIPNDKDLHSTLALFTDKFLSNDCFDFYDSYAEVLSKLFDFVSSVSGRTGGEFFTPLEVTKLMAYIVNKEKCQSVFDPFCGTASIIHYLSNDNGNVLFMGQEINYEISIYARLNGEAKYGRDDVIRMTDSITHWNDRRYQAVVSCPPMGLKLTPEQMSDVKLALPNLKENTFDEVVFVRPFWVNNTSLTVTLVPSSFCFKGNSTYRLRRSLVERNIVDTVISLPENILYGSSIACTIIVCKKSRLSSDPIRFICAEDYHKGGKTERTFDYERFIKMMEGDSNDCTEVSLEDVRKIDYNLSPTVYNKSKRSLESDQRLVRLEEILSPVNGSPLIGKATKGLITTNEFSNDFIGILLNCNKKTAPEEIRNKPYYRVYWPSSDKFLLVYLDSTGLKYGINTDGGNFVCPGNVKVFKIDNSIVTPEYLAYALTNHVVISKSRMPFTAYMKLPIVVDSLAKQNEIVNKISQQHAAKAKAEQEADAKRLGVKQNVSDLDHMLQTTYANIDDIIYKLDKLQPEDNVLHTLVKGLKDNVDYLKRVIQYDNANISSEKFNIKEHDIEEFIRDYCSSWRNYSGNYFSLSYKSNLGNNKKVMFDKTFFKVMLDSILTNAERHGFDKRRSDDNNVEISLSTEKYGDKAYVVIRVANNGYPFKNGFTIKDYITRGRYSANTGRSGLGGYHVYSIIKGHGGFMYIDSNKIWSVIIELLLPINNVELDNLVEYENECI